MNHAMINKIAQAVLYEGYILYPYRPSVKNQSRWTFGGIFPQAYSENNATGDASFLHTECIVLGTEATTLESKVRFLHLVDRQVGRVREPRKRIDDEVMIDLVDSLEAGGRKYYRWQEAIEREVIIPTASLADLCRKPEQLRFAFPSSHAREEIFDENAQELGVLFRRQQAVEGLVEISAEQVEAGVFRISARVSNCTALTPFPGTPGEGWGEGHMRESEKSPHPNPLPEYREREQRFSCRDAALLQSFCSTHLALGVIEGQFVSMTDPPGQLQKAVEACHNVGVWPVLVGEPGSTDALLASPIILYDYPQIAPESPGDLFDGGEIDEILTLRIKTLTDEEKRDVAALDPRAEAMLKRTESLAREQLMNLHGTMRNADPFSASEIFPSWDVASDRPAVPSISAGGVELHPGDRVRLRPRGGADAFDILLNGKIATIAKIEQDFEDRIHLAVTVDDDPGADFGMAGKPGHRFFFRVDEVEPIA